MIDSPRRDPAVICLYARRVQFFGTHLCIRCADASIFAYCRGIFVNSTEAQKKVAGCIAEVRLSAVCFRSFLPAVRVCSVKQSSFSQVIEYCDSESMLIGFPMAMIKEWPNYGIRRLIDCMEVDPTLDFVAVKHQCELH